MAKGSAEAELFKACRAVVWDEAPMMQAHAISAVDRMLQDVCECPTLFAGKLFIFAGDYRQLLPVLEYGTVSDSIAACLKNYSRIWDSVQVFELTKNVRLESLSGADAVEQREFSDWLIRVGDGAEREYPTVSPHAIRLPPRIVAPSSDVERLIDSVFDDASRFRDEKYMTERVILSPLNVDVTAINASVLNRLPGTSRRYTCVDTLEKLLGYEDMVWFTPEMLAMIEAASIPPAHLDLKVGMVVMLIRNVNGNDGQVI